EGMYHAQQMDSEIKNPSDKIEVLSADYFSQSIDTAAMEADNTNGWLDQASQTLHMVIPTQSPPELAEEIPKMLAKMRTPIRRLVLHPCYTVGYGSKDHSSFPFVGTMVAIYGDDTLIYWPV